MRLRVEPHALFSRLMLTSSALLLVLLSIPLVLPSLTDRASGSAQFSLLNSALALQQPRCASRGLLERTNRQLRRKFRQACSFASQRGAEVALYLQAQRLNARWSKTKTTWWETYRSLFFDWLNLHP